MITKEEIQEMKARKETQEVFQNVTTSWNDGKRLEIVIWNDKKPDPRFKSAEALPQMRDIIRVSFTRHSFSFTLSLSHTHTRTHTDIHTQSRVLS